MHLQPAQAPELARFAPTEYQAAQVLSDLADPAQSLLSVARSHKTSIESLCLWLSRPEISERIATMRSAAALRTRWLAAEHLPACAQLASRIVQSALESPALTTPDSALRAARLLLRLASFDPNARPRPAQAPKPQHTPDPSSPPSQVASSVSSAPSVESDPSIPYVPSDSIAPPASHTQPDRSDAARAPNHFESHAESTATTTSDPSTDSLNLPPGLLTALLPSFKNSDRNPFLPEPGLLKTAPNQRALVKMRLKQQRKQVVDEALAFLRHNNCCTESQLPLARHEIEAFYLRGEAELLAATTHSSRSPPSHRAFSSSHAA